MEDAQVRLKPGRDKTINGQAKIPLQGRDYPLSRGCVPRGLEPSHREWSRQSARLLLAAHRVGQRSGMSLEKGLRRQLARAMMTRWPATVPDEGLLVVFTILAPLAAARLSRP